MVRKDKEYGEALVSYYLPTKPARRYLNCCRTAGWHRCNTLYRMRYETGLEVVLVLFTVKGCGYLQLGGDRRILQEGSIVMVPPHIPIEYGTETGYGDMWEFYWLNLEGSHIETTVMNLEEDGLFPHICGNRNAYVQLFRALLEDPAADERQEQLHMRLIGALSDLMLGEMLFDTSAQQPSPDLRGDRMIAYIQDHYHEDVTLEDLSHLFFLSQNQLIRVFRKRTGYTPYEYIKRYRLTKACELLEGTDLQICEIARRVGYGNSSHFTAQFGMQYGISPKEYRLRFSPKEV